MELNSPFENLHKYIGEIKIAENCFVEIINRITDGETSTLNLENYDDSYSLLGYSKMRNYSEKKYNYIGDILLNNTFYLKYQFTNYKSYISVNVNKNLLNDDDNKTDVIAYYIPHIQYLTMYFTDKLFKKYTIDEFIVNLINC
jgi:hypothetical protein